MGFNLAFKRLKRKTPANVLKFYENGKQRSNKPLHMITEKCSKNVHALISGEKIENIKK
jgi:hypothetical protein